MTRSRNAAPRLARAVRPAGPFRPGAFGSALHETRVASILSVALGVSFTICFLTGLASHWAQLAQPAIAWPAAPRDLYRWTQGAHVVSGVVSIPLLLGKLFSVYPRLWAWPPLAGAAHAVERLALVPLVGGSLLLLLTGLQDVFYWYPTPFAFTVTHYWTAWVTIGALVVHVGAKLTVAADALRHGDRAGDGRAASKSASSGEAAGGGQATSSARATAGHGATTWAGEAAGTAGPAAGDQAVRDRRWFLGAVAGAAGVVGVGFLAQVVSPLRLLAVLTPRRSDAGSQGVPVNKDARTAGVVERASDPAFRLQVVGAVARPLRLSLDDLRARASREADLPITCVEGWSVGARWRGVPVRALLAEAGAGAFTSILVSSLQPSGPFRNSRLSRAQALHPDTLLAVELNGGPLELDHGFPVRLIAPNRPGVLQTKWVGSVRAE
jgi:DMSO/TMAO reductase YedYZ molybdopterin-dependent catalytic subunit